MSRTGHGRKLALTIYPRSQRAQKKRGCRANKKIVYLSFSHTVTVRRHINNESSKASSAYSYILMGCYGVKSVQCLAQQKIWCVQGNALLFWQNMISTCTKEKNMALFFFNI